MMDPGIIKNFGAASTWRSGKFQGIDCLPVQWDIPITLLALSLMGYANNIAGTRHNVIPLVPFAI